MNTAYHDLACQITATLDAAHNRRNAIAEQIIDLKQRGCYNALPREAEDHRPTGTYLYLWFKQDPAGNYYGPNGRQKLYIGNDPEAIAKAKANVQRTSKVLLLIDEQRQLEEWIAQTERDLNAIALRCARLPRSRLGQTVAAGSNGR